MHDLSYIHPVLLIILIAILWAIVIFGPRTKRWIDAKRLDNTWKSNQFTKK